MHLSGTNRHYKASIPQNFEKTLSFSLFDIHAKSQSTQSFRIGTGKLIPVFGSILLSYRELRTSFMDIAEGKFLLLENCIRKWEELDFQFVCLEKLRPWSNQREHLRVFAESPIRHKY
jgi:hypothetical protein